MGPTSVVKHFTAEFKKTHGRFWDPPPPVWEPLFYTEDNCGSYVTFGHFQFYLLWGGGGELLLLNVAVSLFSNLGLISVSYFPSSVVIMRAT